LTGDRERWQERHRVQPERAAPSPFVARFVAQIAYGARGGRALDLACGAGRHAALLAQHGFRTVALDHASAACHRVVAELTEVDAVVADAAALPLRAASFTVIVVTLFLDRSVLPGLITLLAPGGVLLVETFLVAQHEATGHPRRDFCLEPGELVHLCTGDSARLLEAREGPITTASGIVQLSSLAVCKV
jgi:SAM-dependent methyltransferase